MLENKGVVAQLGERMTGSHEVRGSIPLDSTNKFNSLGHLSRCPFLVWGVNGVSNLTEFSCFLIKHFT